MGSLKACWGSRSEFENSFLNIDPITMAYSLNSATPGHLTSIDPKYVSSKALQRQHSEGAASKVPCILPIIENGKKVSSTHYYLLPERPPYLDRYEKFFQEAEETHAIQPLPADCGVVSGTEKPDSKLKTDMGGHGKRKHLSYVVSP
ncbi:hypothetical protein CB1_029410006 [Camelus ferus]|nr:hypothetical protein CB1_029410006 [Camelus ferus]